MIRLGLWGAAALAAALGLLAGCSTQVHFIPHGTTGQPFKAPLTLGVYYTTGTLARVETYENRNVSWFRTWYVHVGEALEQEALSRFKPRVERLARSESPFPRGKVDLVLSLGIDEFVWKNSRAETKVTAVLRGPDGVVLLDKTYLGTGSAQLHRITAKTTPPAQGIGETTREAMVVVLGNLLEDMAPYLVRPAEKQPASTSPGGG